jgi:hypothetical protein
MGDFFFVVKCFAITLGIVVLLQIKVGSRTIEAHTVNWIHRSGFVQQLQDVAEGAVKAGKNGSREVADLFEDSTDEIIPRNEASTGWLKIKRSEAYYKQKAREKKQKAAEQDSALSSEDTEYGN